MSGRRRSETMPIDMQSHPSSFGSERAMQLVTLLGLLVIVALPIAFVVLQAIFPELAQGSWSRPFARLGTILNEPHLAALTLNTIRLGLAVVVVTASVGVPLGVIRGLVQLPGAFVWDVLFLLPFLIPPYIAAMGWMMVLQPSGYLQQIAGVHAQSFLFSFWGVVFVMSLNVSPVVYFAVSRAVAAAGSRLSEVGRVCGGTAWQCLIRITLPLALPAVAGSLLLVFAMSIEEFGTPAVLAANTGFFVLVTAIERRFAEWPIDLPGASLLSLILVALAMTVFLIQRR